MPTYQTSISLIKRAVSSRYPITKLVSEIYHRRQTWVQLQKQPFCSKPLLPGPSTYHQSLKKLDKMDFLTAAKMLFTNPPKKKKFGLDFHLVQLFFACMPSFAVYLVAQYARYDMGKMEAELELKKKEQEEEKAVELELNATKEKEARSGPELLEVRERLEKLEETVRVIAAKSKKQTVISHAREHEGDGGSKSSGTEATTISSSKSSQAKGHESDSANKSFGGEATAMSNSDSSKPVKKDLVPKQDIIEPRPAAVKDS